MHIGYSALDLKDAFLSLPLAPVSQPFFGFEWADSKIKGKLTWIIDLVLNPQGFKNAPTLFDEALNRDL